MGDIGSYSWAKTRGGNLNRPEELSILSRFVFLRLKRALSGRHSLPQQAAQTVLEKPLKLPDSALVNNALEHCSVECSVAVYRHSCRMYFWGTAFGHLGGLSFDAEQLALASLLHDIELGKLDRRHQFNCSCFAGAGAIAAERFLTQRGMHAAPAQDIAEAISRHINPLVPLSKGSIGHLLNAAATADVVGRRIQEINQGDRKAVFSAYPRAGLKESIIECMEIEKKAGPRTRAAFLMRNGFERLIAD